MTNLKDVINYINNNENIRVFTAIDSFGVYTGDGVFVSFHIEFRDAYVRIWNTIYIDMYIKYEDEPLTLDLFNLVLDKKMIYNTGSIPNQDQLLFNMRQNIVMRMI